MANVAHNASRYLIGSLLAVACAGCPEDGPVFTAELRGDNVIISAESEEGLFETVCTERPSIEKRTGDTWEPRRWEVPENFHSGYYLDGIYAPPVVGYGCDLVRCVPMDGGGTNAGPAVETVAAGTREPPAWVKNPNAARPAPAYESEPIVGPLRVRFTYYEDSDCRSPKTAEVTLDIPADGVCCPVGEPGCGSDGPSGGWATSLERCQEWWVTDMDRSERYIDARGCDTLRSIYPWAIDPALPMCGAP